MAASSPSPVRRLSARAWRPRKPSWPSSKPSGRLDRPAAQGHAHPALIARYVDDLLTTLDTDVPKARAILMRVLRPFTLTPDGASERIPGPSTFRLWWAPESLKN
jgi:hypothetical protein